MDRARSATVRGDVDALRAGIREHLAEAGGTLIARNRLEDDADMPAKWWQGAVELGADHGVDPIEAGYVLATELGRIAGPPAVGMSWCVSEAVRRWAGPDPDDIFGVALWESDGRVGIDSVSASVERRRLSGTKLASMELGATRAAVYGRGTDGHVRLYLVDLDHPRVEISWLTGLGGAHTLASIQFDKVPVAPLGDAAAAPWLLNAIAIFLGGVGVGGARRCLELGVRYSHERYAFGSPIGSFQAIRHKLADMYTGVELADSCVRTGFSVLESDGDDLALAAAVSRVSALDAYRFAAEEAIEVHGAVGYTWDSDLHLYLRNARLIEGVLGPVEWWRGQVLDCYEAGDT